MTEVVAEMTGYPAELLEPDLDLEADLGVDTVKQAEVFAAVRERYEVERDDNLQLRDFPTLHHVAAWVRDRPDSARAGTGAAAAADRVPSAAAVEPARCDEVLAAVTTVVAEMTGYPAELLEPDLDLEADLGVDTVKQAEVFAAVRERYDVERDDNLQLRDFPTLRHVAAWVRDRAGLARRRRPHPASAGDATPDPDAAPHVVQGDFDAVDALPRRVPVPSLRPGIVAVPADRGRTRWRTRGRDARRGRRRRRARQAARQGRRDAARARTRASATDELLAQVGAWHDEAPIDGVYWLPALDADGDLADYDLERWREALRRRVKALYATMRHLYDASPFLVVGDPPRRLPRLRRRRGDQPARRTGRRVHQVVQEGTPDALVKAVDLAESRKTKAIAEQLIEETLHDPGCVEIGRVDGRRFGVAFVESPFPERDDG